jgi:hypothetical protein
MTTPTPSSRRPLLAATRVLAVLGLLGFAAHTGLGLGGDGAEGFFNDWVYNGLVLISAGWCISRAILVRTDRGAWALIGFGLACWATAEILNTVYLSRLDDPPYPSIADAFWLGFYPASYGTHVDGCVMNTGSEVTLAITASDPDTDAAMLMYETTAVGCTTQSDGAETILLCPQVAPYGTTVTVTDPEGNDDSIMFQIGVCTDGMAP